VHVHSEDIIGAWTFLHTMAGEHIPTLDEERTGHDSQDMQSAAHTVKRKVKETKKIREGTAEG
jgi:hypothetical protein